MRHHTRRQFKPRLQLQEPQQQSEPPAGTGGGQTLREAGSEQNESSRCSGPSAGGHSEAGSGARHALREVAVPMPSREDLGTAHTEPPVDGVTLAPRQPDPPWTQKVPPGPDGRQQHLSAVWDMVLESRGMQRTLRISFPSPIVVMGGSLGTR